jgi:hypothetical protein
VQSLGRFISRSLTCLGGEGAEKNEFVDLVVVVLMHLTVSWIESLACEKLVSVSCSEVR